MKRSKVFLLWAVLSVFMTCLPVAIASQNGYFSLQKYVTGTASTLRIWVDAKDTMTGEVTINGMDTAQPTTPFTFSWGDGQDNSGFFQQHHTYQDRTRNYVVKVTAHYAGGATDEAEILVFFVPPEVNPKPLPSSLSVTIPDHPVILGSNIPGYTYTPPSDLTAFDDSFFTVIPRATAEYVLSAAATIEEDLVNRNHLTVNGGFQQVILREPGSPGAQAVFVASPLAVFAGEHEFQGSFKWSVFFHETAHNFQLNSPADFRFGVKAGGRAAGYLAESVARIFQCATACELLNDSERYGLGQEISYDIGLSTIDMVKEIRGHYESYLSSGMHFCSWNDPSTTSDDPYDTFCTLATKFLVHAEDQDLGYRIPVKRMMKLLQTFDQEALAKYDPQHDSVQGATFRSTFMVAALSFAFKEDLRPEFRALNFPISDADYEELWQKADTDPADFSLNVTPDTLTVPSGGTATCSIGVAPLNGLTHTVDLRTRMTAPIAGVGLALSNRTVEPGGTATLTVTADPSVQPSSFSIRLQATGEYTAHAADIAVTVIWAPILSVTPLSYDFGNVKVKKSNSGSFKVQNNGKANLSISTSLTGPDASMFKLGGGGNKTIKPGKFATVKVTFKPTSTGLKQATLRITSNDPDSPITDIPLSGTGQ